MSGLNCDIKHVTEGIEKLKESDDYSSLTVWDTDAVMRGIPHKEMRNRNLFSFSETVCYIEEEVTDCYRFMFHEKEVDSDFTWQGSSNHATMPKEMGDNLRQVVMEIEDEYGNDIMWDFAELSAASIGEFGRFCDFEFEYELVV